MNRRYHVCPKLKLAVAVIENHDALVSDIFRWIKSGELTQVERWSETINSLESWNRDGVRSFDEASCMRLGARSSSCGVVGRFIRFPRVPST